MGNDFQAARPALGLDVRAIAAVARNRVIGRDGHLPWNLPEDRQYLEDCVRGGIVIEGRRCYESRGKAFPGAERTVVLSSREDWSPEDASVCSSLEDAYQLLQGETRPVWILGGERLYHESLTHWRRLFLTLIHEDFEGDTHFPDWKQRFVKQIRRNDSHQGDLRYSFLVLAPVEDEKECAP